MNARRPRPKKPRAYNSELRKVQAEQTAGIILDAVLVLLNRGDKELAYTSIAKEAKVSVPTVYRHFPTPADLLRALGARDEERHAELRFPSELGLEQASALLDTFFQRFDDPNDPLQGGRLNIIWEFSRVATVPKRRAYLEALVDRELPGLAPHERALLVDNGIVLISSAAGEIYRGYLGLRAGEMAERVRYVLNAMFAHARSHLPARPSEAPTKKRRRSRS